jgi:FemAB-related protein (PEP-CTERM system-associated)
MVQAWTNAVDTAVTVRQFTPAAAQAWDNYVLRHPDGSIFHLTAWKNALQYAFHYEARYLYAEADGQITGIAPVFFIHNWIVGKALISVPLAVNGGICADDDASLAALSEEIQRMGREEQVGFIELRAQRGPVAPGFSAAKSIYVNFSTALSQDFDANLKRLPRDTRYMIRKAEKQGLEVRHGLDQMTQFYRLHAISLRRLGTPVFPLGLFEKQVESFSPNVDLMLVYAGAQPVTGVLSFFHRDTILPYYAGAAPEAGKLAANNLMYWELMKFAVEKGFRFFDFGRSKVGTGAYAFKTQWNMPARPLAYQLLLIRRTTNPNFSPANPKFGLAQRVWSRLPLPVTMAAGPHLVGLFP